MVLFYFVNNTLIHHVFLSLLVFVIFPTLFCAYLCLVNLSAPLYLSLCFFYTLCWFACVCFSSCSRFCSLWLPGSFCLHSLVFLGFSFAWQLFVSCLFISCILDFVIRAYFLFNQYSGSLALPTDVYYWQPDCLCTLSSICRARFKQQSLSPVGKSSRRGERCLGGVQGFSTSPPPCPGPSAAPRSPQRDLWSLILTTPSSPGCGRRRWHDRRRSRDRLANDVTDCFEMTCSYCWSKLS